jgi:hypothetical protein
LNSSFHKNFHGFLYHLFLIGATYSILARLGRGPFNSRKEGVGVDDFFDMALCYQLLTIISRKMNVIPICHHCLQTHQNERQKAGIVLIPAFCKDV